MLFILECCWRENNVDERPSSSPQCELSKAAGALYRSGSGYDAWQQHTTQQQQAPPGDAASMSILVANVIA